MKIVIDIPEEDYKNILDISKSYSALNIERIIGTIENGTPLPKGHGRLIDADALEDFIDYHTYPVRYDRNSIDKGMTVNGIGQCFRSAPTIIEADRGE